MNDQVITAGSRCGFFGRVVPERMPLRISDFSATSHPESADVAYEFNVGIADGQIAATATVTQGQTDLHSLRNFLESNIRVATDTIGFLKGISYDIDMISAVSLDTGRRCVFGIGIPVLQQRRRSWQFKGSLEELMRVVGQELHAQVVLADFREAMRIPVGTGFFCYRAVEAVMQSMRAEKEDERQVWPRLRQALRVEQNALMYIKSHSDFPRHGRPSSISDEQRAKVFALTDEVICRYLEYLLRGKTALDENAFPMLS